MLIIGKTTTPPLNINPDGTITISKLVLNDIYGFTFVPYTYNILIPGTGGNHGYLQRKTFLSLQGLSNEATSIGSWNMHMHSIYSKSIYSSGGTAGVLPLSDAKLKTNIRKLSSTSEKILRLNPVTYDFVKSGSGKDVSEDADYKNRTGFIAQEVQEIFPDLVLMGDDSLLRLDYAGLIPYLTKAFQEQAQSIQKQDELILAQERINKEQSQIIEKQSKEISELRKQMHDIQQGAYTADFIIGGEPAQPNRAPKSQENGADNALYQNAPNPFNISTTIKYQLSDNVANAKICIYNLTGKQLQCHNLPTAKGENSIEVRASSLQSGMYLYSLIVDDKLIDTKRMVLTE